MNQGNTPADHWTTLWRSGVLHSCGHSLAGNYDGEIAQFWQAQLSTLPPSACVVDLGTGNGPLLLLARSLRPDLELHGVDLARIDPKANCQHDYGAIRFHPGCNMADLPLPDHSVDLFISQYGFEYGPHPQTEQGLLAKLRPGGGVALILHATDSNVSRNTAHQLAAADQLTRTGLFDAATSLSGKLLITPAAGRRQLASDPEAELLRQHFNHAAGLALDLLQRHPDASLLAEAIQCIRHALEMATRGDQRAIALLVQGRERMNSHVQRLQDFQQAVLTDAQMEICIATFGTGQLRCSVAPLHYKGKVMGRYLLAGSHAVDV
jgi:hypothetical protein